jgi:hypothetical protein
LTLLYWQIGQRIRDEVLLGERAEYGEQIISTLAWQLEADFGRGFSSKNLRHMLRFVEAYPDSEIVSALSRQLAWSHFLELIYLKDPLQRDFYTQMCEQEHWSVRQLRERKQTLLFERTAISRQPDQLLTQELARLRECRRVPAPVAAQVTAAAKTARGHSPFPRAPGEPWRRTALTGALLKQR